MNELIKELETIRDVGIVNHKKDTATLQQAIDTLKAFTWHDPSKPPETDEDGYSDYVLLSFSNCSVATIGLYIKAEDGGAYHDGDDDRTLESYDLHVNGWMELPENAK